MFWPKRSPDLMDVLRVSVSQTRPPVLEALKHYHRQLQKHFDSACWPSILRNLKELKCPKKLFNLSRSYFSNRTASLCGNTMKIEKPVTMGCPQISCRGPGFWNIFYNSLLNMDSTHRTRVIAFADGLLVLTRGKCTLDAENYAN
jgi:hypothetical protein